MKKPLIYTALAAASVMAGGFGSAAQALTEPGFQTCSFLEGEITVDIPTDKSCTTTMDVMVNEINQNVILSAINYDPATNDVEYQLLEPFTITLPGPDGDQVKINALSTILDPTGNFDVSYADFGAPSNFSTMFTFPNFVPTLSGLVNFTGSVSGTLTDGTSPRNGVGLTVTNPAGLVTYDLRRGATTVGSFNLGSSISFPPAEPGSSDSHTYGPFSNTDTPLMPDCGVLSCDNVKLTLAFSGTGGSDRYGFTGRWDVEMKDIPSTPEPSATVAVVGAGLFGLSSFFRRRKR